MFNFVPRLFRSGVRFFVGTKVVWVFRVLEERNL